MHGHSVLCTWAGHRLVLCSGQGTTLCCVVIDSPQVLNLSAEVLSAVVSAEQAQNSSAACLAALGQHYRLQGDLHNDVYLLKRANRTLTVSARIAPALSGKCMCRLPSGPNRRE